MMTCYAHCFRRTRLMRYYAAIRHFRLFYAIFCFADIV